MIRLTYFYICVVFGYGILAADLWGGKVPVVAWALFVLAVVWMLTYFRDWHQYNPLGLIIGILANVYAAWQQISPYSSIVSTVSILIAWDLANFRAYLILADLDDSLSVTIRQHLVSIFLFFVVATFVMTAAIQLQLNLSFTTAVILLFMTFIGLIQLVRWLLKNNLQ